ncbi:MAG: hypothetical protein IPK72_01410 [Candidatus Eisenbacteria bacterium]|nr:hypothetical protein [Candidatus Eisenbacteria bacterium]
MIEGTSTTRNSGARIGAILSALALAMLSACSSDDGEQPPGAIYDARPILERATRGVIWSTYSDLAQAARTLHDATEDLAASRSEAALDLTQAAWRAARRPWEQSEGFLFGPVSDHGIDPAIDSWPVNDVDLDAVLESDTPLTEPVVDQLSDELKGFHTIEYLLFGSDGAKTVDDLTERELAYLVACAANLERKTGELAAAWDPSGDDFGRLLIETGPQNPRYGSQLSSMQELLEGMVAIADEVANGKIADPFSAQDVTLEESRFSRNSILDFQDNIRSIQHLYLGDRDGVLGVGYDSFVRWVDPALDTRVQLEIQAAVDAIGAIPPPFTSAIFEAPDAIIAAQSAVRALLDTLDGEVRALNGELIQ